MDQEFKQGFIDNIIALRGFPPDEAITKILQDLVKEEISDEIFFAKVYTELTVYDTVGLTMSDDLIQFNAQFEGTERRRDINTPRNTFNYALNNYLKSSGVQEDPWGIARTDEARERNDIIYKGLDIAAGIKGPSMEGEAKNWSEYLNTRLEEIVDETGLLGVVLRPPKGEGGVIYISEDLTEYMENNGTINLNKGFYPEAGKKYRKYPGFSAPTVLTSPVMTYNEEKDTWEFTGNYLNGTVAFGENGKFLTENDVRDTFTIAIGTINSDGTTTVSDIKVVSEGELAFQEQELSLNQEIIYLEDDKDLQKQQIDVWQSANGLTSNGLEYDVFGDITPDYAIYKRPDLADAFKDQDPTVGQMQDAMLPKQIYAGEIPTEQFYGGFDHISGQGIGPNGTQKISWISLAPQEIKAIQVDLMQAGYLSAEDFFLEQGAWQDKTSMAMYSAMTDANLSFTDISTQLTVEKERYFTKPPLQPKVYSQPSPQYIKSEIDAALKSAGVTRKLSDAELVAFSDYYLQADKDYETANAEYQKNLDLAERLFPGAPSAITIPTTPRQELESYVEQKFEPELAAQARGKKEKNDLSYLFSSLDQFDQMIGG
jgi:hypothetical protein